MTLNLSLPGQEDLKPRITVFGVGGAGGNAVNNMIEQALDGVEFVVANTDAQALQQSRATAKIQMGVKVTEGLGAGARATVGAAAAEESIEQIVDHLAGAHMCFITAGMGGGTGTGAAPIIAQAARELGVLTVGVVTKPFQFEGTKRMRQAEEGIEALQRVVDTLIIIPNQNLFRLASERTTFTEAFALADDVLYQGVKGVTDLMVRPGLINLDFADVRAVMDEMGKAMMGTGEAEGDNRAVQAAEKAIANPLLDEISLEGAKGVLINITGGYDLTLFELDEAANKIREKVDPDANIIVGSTLDPSMEGRMRVSVVATGIDAVISHADVPLPRRSMANPLRQSVSAEAPAARPAPQPQPVAARAAAPAYEPASASAPAAPMPSLFDDERYSDAQDDAYDTVASDELPPPAYRPRPEPVIEAAPETFVAPRAPVPGTPSPEALARLHAAVNRAPMQAPMQSSRPEPRPEPRVEARAEPRAEPAARPAEGARFGINSLINRMTGSASEPAQPARQQPQVSAQRELPEADPEQERIEIPAFLRRQAN
ncbi:MAG: cell division protein FtsZ [Rhodobacterales bacterium]|nr:cell division protein FtsZ [Rhodobacterales bacterium]NCT11556.1 cell division protein FtsZ [Rhodobacterales bacterium]